MSRIKGGYVLQPRSFDKSKASKLPPVTREIWFWLLRNVNRFDRNGIGFGCGFFRLDEIAEGLHWFVGYRKEVYSKPQITKSLRRLCDAKMIVTTKEIRGVIVKVLNYAYYQDPKNYEGNDEGNAKETRREKGGHTTHKKDKELEESKNVPSSKKPTKEPIEIEYPPSLDNDEFKVAWGDWMVFRAEIKKKLTPTTIRKQLTQLEKMGVHNAIASLEQSMKNGWQGLFEVKANGSGLKNGKTFFEQNSESAVIWMKKQMEADNGQ